MVVRLSDFISTLLEIQAYIMPQNLNIWLIYWSGRIVHNASKCFDKEHLKFYVNFCFFNYCCEPGIHLYYLLFY